MEIVTFQSKSENFYYYTLGKNIKYFIIYYINNFKL